MKLMKMWKAMKNDNIMTNKVMKTNVIWNEMKVNVKEEMKYEENEEENMK